MDQIQLDLIFEWNPVCQAKGESYCFPNPISYYMRTQYHFPAVYRWNIYKNEPGDQQIFYIGEAQELCPQRINGYLNPGPSQKTNQRMNTELMSFLAQDFKIALDFLQIKSLTCKTLIYTKENLGDKYLRRLIEELMVLTAYQEGHHLLNL